MIHNAHDYIVLLDGVLIPNVQVSFQWRADSGTTGCTLVLPGWSDAAKIQESTQVEVYHAHARGYVHARRVVRVPYTASMSPDEDALRSSFRDECSQTIGASAKARATWPDGSTQRVSFADLTGHENHGLRWSGYVVAPSRSSTSGGTVNQILTCRGIDHKWETTKLIQLIGGMGTLAESERRFFGQDTETERQNGTLLAGTGRRDMANAILALLKERDGNFSVGVRRLLSQYARLVNRSTLHTYESLRALNQMSVVDDDETVQRLIGTTAFDRYLRDSIQNLYVAPLKQALSLILSFIGYRIIPVPSPPYFPLGIAPGTRTETVTTRGPGRRAGAGLGTVSWSSWHYLAESTDESLAFLEQLNAAGSVSSRPSVSPNVGGWIAPGSAEIAVEADGRSFSFTIPSSRTSFGSLSMLVRLPDIGRVDWRSAPDSPGNVVGAVPRILVPGDYRFGAQVQSMEGSPTALIIAPGLDLLDMRMTVSRGPSVSATVSITEERPVPPDEGEAQSTQMARLGSYAILPNLWFAIPPMSNILLPSHVIRKQTSSAGMERITRMVAKVQPGVSGSRRSYVDTFAAPNSSDMNRAVQDTDDDLLDARNLTVREYLTGVNAEVSFLDSMARLVKKADFEKYLKYRIIQQFWDKFLAGEVMELTIRHTPSLVIGTTALVIVDYGSQTGAEDITPEQRALLRRISVLRSWRAQILRCIASRSGTGARRAVIERYLIGLIVSADAAREVRTSARFAQQRDSDDPTQIENVMGIEQDDGTVGNFALGFLNDTYQPTVGGIFADEVATSRTIDGEQYEVSGARLQVYAEGVTAEALTQLIGPEALVIVPGGGGRITQLPSVSTLREWLARVRSSGDGSTCLDALRHDLRIIDQAIEDSRTRLAGLGGSVREEEAYFGYVQSILEQVTAQGPVMNVSMTHVRRVGEDIDQDGIAGDDPEATVAFGEDGYLDSKYAIDRIGTDVYAQVFGCRSLADHPFVQNDLVDDLDEEDSSGSSSTPSDAEDIREAMTHPAVCGHSCLDEDQTAGRSSGLTATYVARSFIKRLREMSDASASRWADENTQRPGLTLPDAHRNGTLYYARDERAISRIPEDFFDESDRILYPDGAPLDGFFSKSFPDVDASAPTEKMRYHSDMTPEEREAVTRRKRLVVAVANRAKSSGYTDK